MQKRAFILSALLVLIGSMAAGAAPGISFSINGIKTNSDIVAGLPLPTGLDLGFEIPLGTEMTSLTLRAVAGYESRMILRNSATSLPIAEADLGLPWNWRVGPAARAVGDASYAALGFTPTGRGLVPFAPVHVEQPWRTARNPGDLTIRWTRRSRALVADAWEQVEVPLAEDQESYDVQILDGAAVKRTLTASTTSVLYTAAQQTADWGAPLGPGQTLAIRIFQLSNRLGRGTPAAVTLQF